MNRNSTWRARRLLQGLVWAILISGVLGGCQSTALWDRCDEAATGERFSAAFAAGLRPGMIRRVLLLPLENRTTTLRASDGLHQHLLGRLRGAGMFEIVDGHDWLQSPCSAEQVARGEFAESLLVQAYQQFNADAVMFVSVNEYQPYAPLGLGLTLHMIETYDAQPLATIDGYWSQNNPQTAGHFAQFVAESGAGEHELDALLGSPNRFADYVAAQIVERLATRFLGGR
jgi:hypothetical protein